MQMTDVVPCASRTMRSDALDAQMGSNVAEAETRVGSKV